MAKGIRILYEDEDILAIDKPSGLAVHSNGRSKEKTVTDWVLKNYPEMAGVGEPKGVVDRPGIVHRLDRETSGVLLLAKNRKTFEFLKKQFSAPALEIAKGGLADRQNRINKIYVAIVNGWVKNDHGIINKPIGRSPRDFRRRLAGRGARGEMREAITEYKVLKRFTSPRPSPTPPEFGLGTQTRPLSGEEHLIPPDKGEHKGVQGEGEKFTYLEIKPKTGRTHQIRVHLKYINHPVACDELYAPGKPCPKGLSRLALHAKSIEFSTLGGSACGGKNLKGETIKVESPLPREFKKMIK